MAGLGSFVGGFVGGVDTRQRWDDRKRNQGFEDEDRAWARENQEWAREDRTWTHEDRQYTREERQRLRSEQDRILALQQAERDMWANAFDSQPPQARTINDAAPPADQGTFPQQATLSYGDVGQPEAQPAPNNPAQRQGPVQDGTTLPPRSIASSEDPRLAGRDAPGQLSPAPMPDSAPVQPRLQNSDQTGYTFADWRAMSRGEREAAGLPVSEIGGQLHFDRFSEGLGIPYDPGTRPLTTDPNVPPEIGSSPQALPPPPMSEPAPRAPGGADPSVPRQLGAPEPAMPPAEPQPRSIVDDQTATVSQSPELAADRQPAPPVAPPADTAPVPIADPAAQGSPGSEIAAAVVGGQMDTTPPPRSATSPELSYGTWLYGLTMLLLSLFFPGDDDDMEEEFKRVVVETLGVHVGGALLNGLPGHVTGIDLTSRIGMPDLWFRSPERPLEGQDAYNYWLSEIAGAIPGIAESMLKGAEKIGEGDIMRGVEGMVPKAVRDILRTYRYYTEGATTTKGDPLVDELPTLDMVKQALGFTPAIIAERYDVNSRLYTQQGEILDARSSLLSEAAKMVMAGTPLDQDIRDRLAAFNAANPDYPITGRNIARSVDARQQARDRAEFGATLNPRLNDRLRAERAPLVYGTTP